jgi:hypothetical protein
MKQQLPTFGCRLLDDMSGFTIDAIMPTGEITQLAGVFISRDSALDQIEEYRRNWWTDASLQATQASSPGAEELQQLSFTP